MKKGFIHIAAKCIDSPLYEMLREASCKCDSLTVGILGDWAYARLYDTNEGYNAEVFAELLSHLDVISEVVILEPSELTFKAAYEKFGFDLYFIGSEYGKELKSDLEYAKEKGIETVSLAPKAYESMGGIDSLTIALNNVQPGWKIILFGTGAYFEKYMNCYGEKFKPAYAIDNNVQNHGSSKNGVKIYAPDKLKEENSDNVLVILCGMKYESMREQLLAIGDFNYRTLLFNNAVGMVDELGINLHGEHLYVDEIQKELNEMLALFDEVCREENLNYYLICGSLIGAVRHNGFIPWDDDLDIAMTRDDYNKFRSAFIKKYGDGGRFIIQEITDWKYKIFTDTMSRVVDVTKLYPHKINTNVCKPEDADIFRTAVIDIYVMDSAFDNERMHNFQMNVLKVIYNLAMGHRECVDYSTYSRLGAGLVLLMRIINGVGKLFPLKFLLRCYDSVCQWANRKDTKSFFMGSCVITTIHRKFDKKFFEGKVYEDYDGMKVQIPSDVSGLMNAMGYGNIMEFPPYRYRKSSHYFNSDIEIW